MNVLQRPIRSPPQCRTFALDFDYASFRRALPSCRLSRLERLGQLGRLEIK